jgi:hypothetical protein
LKRKRLAKTHVVANLPGIHFMHSPGIRVPMTMGEVVVGQSLA